MESMTEAEKKSREANRREYLKEYANHVFSFSLVTGVSNIVSAKRWSRKVFKGVVLILCACGFFYQATEFIRYYLTYPHVVDLEVFVVLNFLSPAYTYCNNNGIRRTKFCDKYPERCYVVEDIEKFCSEHSFFCHALKSKENLTMPKQEYYYFEKNITFEELKELGHQKFEDGEMIDNSTIANSLSVFQGPFLAQKDDHVKILCYTKHLRVNSSDDPHRISGRSRFKPTLDEFSFDLEPDEVFRPDRRSGAIFNIHSPYVYENPLDNGIFIKEGRNYVINIRLQEEHLLPAPYKSDCVNYTNVWEENGRNGPRSQQMSIEKCFTDLLFEYCNCTVTLLNYPTDGPFCELLEIYPCVMEAPSEPFEACLTYKDDCEMLRFPYKYQERFKERDPEEDDSVVPQTGINVRATDSEVIRYKYRPQYQRLEVFSTVGGFIGAWLGVSLVAVVDFFESMTMIATFFFRQRKMAKRNENYVAPEDFVSH